MAKRKRLDERLADPILLEKVLKCPMTYDNDADAVTVGDYLKRLLLELWIREEGFSGERPFGNSGWQYEMVLALVKEGLVTGKIDDEYGDLIEFDQDFYEDLIIAAIKHAFRGYV